MVNQFIIMLLLRLAIIPICLLLFLVSCDSLTTTHQSKPHFRTAEHDETSQVAEVSDINQWIASYLSDEIDWDSITHLFYSTITTHSDGSISTNVPYETWVPDQINSIIRTGQSHNVPVLITIGGDDGFRFAIKEENRTKFTKSLIGFLKEWNFEGINLDMRSIENSDVSNYVDFVTELYNALLDIETPLRGKPLLAATSKGTHANMFAGLQRYFDQFILLARDSDGLNEVLDNFLNAGISTYRLSVGLAHDDLNHTITTVNRMGKNNLILDFGLEKEIGVVILGN